jgi:hypothetical protein
MVSWGGFRDECMGVRPGPDSVNALYGPLLDVFPASKPGPEKDGPGGQNHVRETVVTSASGGQKGIKPERYELLPWESLEEVARVYHYGASKYAANNWRKGYEWSLSFGALLRHVALFMMGYDVDKETGLCHMAHAAFHCLTLISFWKTKNGVDDRAKIGG